MTVGALLAELKKLPLNADVVVMEHAEVHESGSGKLLGEVRISKMTKANCGYLWESKKARTYYVTLRAVRGTW